MNVCMYVCIHAWMDGWIHEQAFLRQEFVPRCVDLDGHLRSTGNRASRFTCTHIVRFSVLRVLQHGFKCTRLCRFRMWHHQRFDDRQGLSMAFPELYPYRGHDGNGKVDEAASS